MQMNKTKDQIKIIVQEFEKGKLSENEALLKINELSIVELAAYRLKNYWSSESMEEFIDTLVFERYQDWKSINDKEALILIEEMKQNSSNNSILQRNSQALEKRYGKPTGKMYDYIFHTELTKEEILKALKIDTITYL